METGNDNNMGYNNWQFVCGSHSKLTTSGNYGEWNLALAIIFSACGNTLIGKQLEAIVVLQWQPHLVDQEFDYGQWNLELVIIFSSCGKTYWQPTVFNGNQTWWIKNLTGGGGGEPRRCYCCPERQQFFWWP